MDIPEHALDNILNQLPKPKERRILAGGSQFIEQPTLSSGCIAYQASAQMMSDLHTMVKEEHEGWKFIEFTSARSDRVCYGLAYKPGVIGDKGDVSQALGDAKLICTVDDQKDTSLVSIRAYHEDGSPITDNEIVRRLALVSGKLHQAGYLEGAGSDSETTPVHTRDGTFFFSLPRSDRVFVASADAQEQRARSGALRTGLRRAETQQDVRRGERRLDIIDLQENHVSITVHEMSGPSGSVFILEIPEDYAKGNNIVLKQALKQAHDVLNRAIVELKSRLPGYSSFPDLISLPTLEGEGATSEPHRLFVVATRAQEGLGGRRAGLSKFARKAKDLGMRVKSSGNQVDLTINARVDTIMTISELNLNGALDTLYSALEYIHGDPEYPTHLRVITTNRNAYRMEKGKRSFALSVASI